MFLHAYGMQQTPCCLPGYRAQNCPRLWVHREGNDPISEARHYIRNITFSHPEK
jgi:hypothetical protein